MDETKKDEAQRVVVSFEKAAPITPVKVSPRYEGAVDEIVATAVSRPEVSGQFVRTFLCPACGQDGTVEKFSLQPNGTARCPMCGTPMNET